MGAEARCTVTMGRIKAAGKALLETDALIFRGGDLRLTIPYREMSSVDANHGTLRVTYADGAAHFDLGAVATKWADKIRNPPSRIDKLGVKAGQRVLLQGLFDAQLRAELDGRGACVVSRAAADLDVIFYAASERAALSRLESLRTLLKPDGAVWIVRPKGNAAITEGDVMKAGKAAGFVDVKVVRFSATHTAEKFVIPVAERSRRSRPIER
jgi:hypothetical protein